MLLALLACRAEPLSFVEVPPDRPDEALPLVIAVHGLGDRPESLAALVGSCRLPVRIVAPRGPEPYGDGFTWFPITFSDPPVPDPDGMARSADRLAALIADLRKSRNVVGEPVITGFSQGGMLSFTVAARHPDVVGDAVPIAGVLPERLVPTGPGGPTIHALHGSADATVPVDGARRTVDALRARGWTVRLDVFEGAEHEVTAPMRDAMCAALAEAVR